MTFPSTLLPPFVNIVDNAIHWLSTMRSEDRIITLDADAAGFMISNNGPGIDEENSTRIFEFGESTKPGGRGMGLYLAREGLRREGFDVTLHRYGRSAHPAFLIGRAAKPDAGEEA